MTQTQSAFQQGPVRSFKQSEKLQLLKERFDLSEADLNRVLFLNSRDQSDPWIPPDLLESIARQVGKFKMISVTYDQYERTREQVFYLANVVDEYDRSFPRSGVATVGEAPNGMDIDAETLAASRALGSSLRAAGFDPFRSGSVVDLQLPAMKRPSTLNEEQKNLHEVADQAELRRKDLAKIHLLAENKGLIVGKDDTRYRAWLKQNFNVGTAAILEPATRAGVINSLTQYQDFLADVPVELQADALVA
jgi:hypothetical protein